MIRPIPPRPSFADPAFRLAAAQQLACEVASWRLALGADADRFAPAVPLVDLLITAMAAGSDRVVLATAMVARGWTVDQALAKILDQAFELRGRAFQAAERTWVATHGVCLPLKRRDLVRTSYGTGRIVDLRPDTARYVVAFTEAQVELGTGRLIALEACRLFTRPVRMAA